jgi:hypothetical protein
MGELTWKAVAEWLAPSRSYWLGTTRPDGSPHAAPVWGVVVREVFYLYSERHTVKARNVERDQRVVIHLEDPEDVLIVYGHLVDLGNPDSRPDVLDALANKYNRDGDRAYLPTTDPAFDVLWALRPIRAVGWRLSDFDASQWHWKA